MGTKRMEYWDAGDFCRTFRDAARGSRDEQFRGQFDALADALEPMDREFAACVGYCAEPRESEQECSQLYGDVEEAIRHIETLRAQCFV